MKSSIDKQAIRNSDLREAVQRIKDEFRKWYGLISVRELMKNRILVAEIEAMEKMFVQLGSAR